MKTKFSNSELSHVWANQTQTHGKGSNMFFEGNSIYSYGHHFKIAEHVTNDIGKKCIFFNNKSYSNTTSKHQSLVDRSIPPNVEFFRVRSFFYTLETATAAHTDNIKNYLEYSEQCKTNAIRANKLKNGYISQLKANIELLQKYVHFFSINSLLLDNEEIKKRYFEVFNWIEEYQNSKEFKQWEIKQEQKKIENEAKLVERAKITIEQFRNFQISSIYQNIGHYILRYNKETDNVETSGGVKMAKDLFLSYYQRLINNQLIKGQHVDRYTFNGVDGEIVSVGCHKIPMTEIKNIVAVL